MNARNRTFDRPWLRPLVAAVLVLAVLAAPALATEGLWLHIKVHDPSDANTRVTVNLPVSMIQSMMPMIAQHTEMENGTIVIDSEDFRVQDLRAALESLRDSPDATFAEIESDSERVLVYKDGDTLRIETVESDQGAEVRAQLPMAVIDAMLSRGDNTLDLAAAIQALVDHGEGELVTVRDGETNVRVWIDRFAEAE